MKVSISGSSGFIGSKLVQQFLDKKWSVRKITRESIDLSESDFLSEKIEGADVVINLAGAPVQKRWTKSRKQEILQSRIVTTNKIARAIQNSKVKPAVFISASAIGIYDSTHFHNEESSFFAKDFLGSVCQEWEKSAITALGSTRVVIIRIGIVLGKEGGMIKKINPLFMHGLGGRIGNGEQMMSWIHIKDLTEAVFFLIENNSINGIVNLVSPKPITNDYFTEVMGKILKQPTFIPVPVFGLKLIYGEAAQILITGQKVIPQKLIGSGFRYSYPSIGRAIQDIYKKNEKRKINRR